MTDVKGSLSHKFFSVPYTLLHGLIPAILVSVGLVSMHVNNWCCYAGVIVHPRAKVVNVQCDSHEGHE